MNTSKTWVVGMALVLPLFGCPAEEEETETGASDTTSTSGDGSGDSGSGSTPDPTTTTTDPTTTTVDTGGSDTSGDPPMECMGIGGPGADGEACMSNDDCMSGVCTIFTDVPPNDDAICEAAPADCSTRITGTVLDFTTREPVSDAQMVVAAALQAATNPTGATPLATVTSGADGRVDGVSEGPINAPLGIVGLTGAPSYYLTATGLAAPSDGASAYAVGTNIHDIWVVPEGELADWSDALSGDAEIDAGDLPLGESGGVVGLVRDGSNNPVAGAVVTPEDGGGSSSVIRYLQDDGSFGTDETSDTGIFVITNPGLGENFDVAVGGRVVGGGTAGSAPGAIFTLVVASG